MHNESDCWKWMNKCSKTKQIRAYIVPATKHRERKQKRVKQHSPFYIKFDYFVGNHLCTTDRKKKYNLIYVCIEKKWIHKINREIARERRDRKSERASEQYVYELHKNQVQNHMNIEQCNERIGIGTSPTFQHMHNVRIHSHTHSTTGPSEYVWTMLKYTQHSCCENELMVSCKRSQMSDSMWFCGPFLFHLIQCLTMLSNKCNAIHERETKRNTLDRVCDVR